MGSGRGSKHGEKRFDRILGIRILDLLMNLMSCIYISKWFNILECNVNNLAKLTNEVKQKNHSEETNNSYKVMECIKTITSTSKTLKKLVANKSFHSSYIQR